MIITELGCKETKTDHCQPHWAVPLVVRDAVIVHGWIETWGNSIAIPDAQSVTLTPLSSRSRLLSVVSMQRNERKKPTQRTKLTQRPISALEVIFNVMRSINPRFTYLLTLQYAKNRSGRCIRSHSGAFIAFVALVRRIRCVAYVACVTF